MTRSTYHYYIRQYPNLIKALIRDGYMCVRCKSTESLVVHHLDESRKTGHLNDDLTNLITLCKSCHAYVHHRTIGFRRSNLNFILELRAQGMSLGDIGKTIGVTRQAVHQIIGRSKKFPY